MKKIPILLIIFICGICQLKAQLTVEECQTKARQNYPLIKRYALIEKTKEYNLSNANKGYLPQFALNLKASYQSDVTKIPVSIPGIDIEGMKKDQYTATIDVTQTVWDGGAISSQKEITKASSLVEKKQLDVDMYTINDRVNQLFFGILLLDAQLGQNGILQDELQRNYNLISSYMQNGIANQADLDAVKVEQVKAIQNKAQLESNKTAYIQMLEVMTDEKIDRNTVFIKPYAQDLIVSTEINRPELQLMDAQNEQLNAQKSMIKTGYMPKLGLFLTGGYGRPGLNMLDPNFSPYYIGGIKLSWNFGSLYTKKNDHRKIEASQDNIAVQRKTFLFNTNLEVTQENNEIKKNREMVKYDDEIITLRENVKRSTEVKVANGIKTATDLMQDINNEDMARQDKILHEIQLLLSIYNLKNTTNN